MPDVAVILVETDVLTTGGELNFDVICLENLELSTNLYVNIIVITIFACCAEIVRFGVTSQNALQTRNF